ncbi:MAG: NAD-dependent epimerase/dehydratase family protein [Chloroflexi bacterium]|jgi:nucleoside-diphosphate-sugar epimerase|nr:NAD-dependent epimerase/dehydratase family protein [Chloroflexota bacterium]
MDVVFGGRPLYYADESIPYPNKYLDHYSHSKAIAEQEVIAANDSSGFLTCSMRATGIYGPGDNVRFPTVITALRTENPSRMGDGSARVSNVYVDKCAHAHILAADMLEKGSALEGQCYFITDH